MVENEPATVETIGGETSTAVCGSQEATPRKAASTETADAGEKRLSCVAAALKVLSESSEPMNAQELITAMGSQGLLAQPGGKDSPRDLGTARSS